MIFLKKTKPIVLEAFAPAGELIDLFPIEKGKDRLPSRFQSLPKPHETHTVRNCPGLKDLSSSSFIFPSWGEFEITINTDGKADVVTPVSFYNMPGTSQHSIPAEAPGSWPGYTNIKFHNPWYLYCNEPIKWLMVQPTWHVPDPLRWTPVTGVAEFRYLHVCHINTLWRVYDVPYTTKIKSGDPLVQLIPITERPVTLKLEVMTDDIYKKKFQPWHHAFEYSYQKARAFVEKRK